VTEADVTEEHDDGEAELIPDDAGKEEPSLEEVLQSEAATLAADLEALEAEGVEPELLEELETGVESAAEALVSMREARTKINEVKRDRGYGRSGNAVSQSKPHGNQVNRAKATTRCFDCNLPGHWAGDKECKKPGAGLGKSEKKPGKHVMIAEAMNTEYVMPAETFGEDPPEPHEINAVSAVKGLPTSTLSEALSMQTSTVVLEKSPQLELASDKKLVGALDSACNRTVTGFTWLSGFLIELKKAPADVRALVKRQQEHELFRFGNGGVQRSLEHWRLPMVLGDQLFVFWTSVVDVPSLGLLFGRDYLDGIRAVLNFNRRLLRCDRLGTGHIPLRQLAAGHFLLEIIPRAWIRPGSQRWRKFGQDGVVELQLSFGGWLKQKFGHASQGFPKEHEHLVTESSVCAADLANSGLCQSTTARPTLPALARDVMSTSISAISPIRNGRQVRSASTAGEMASNGAPHVSAKRVARPRAAALALAATIAALGACSIPSDQRHHAIASAGREHSGQWQSAI
jgi:hypothetical protein